jgi:plasmid stabilization system protein ParE
MPHEIRWSHYAEDDLLNLITYIAKDNPDAAQNLKKPAGIKVRTPSTISNVGQAWPSRRHL